MRGEKDGHVEGKIFGGWHVPAVLVDWLLLGGRGRRGVAGDAEGQERGEYAPLVEETVLQWTWRVVLHQLAKVENAGNVLAVRKEEYAYVNELVILDRHRTRFLHVRL